MKKFILLILLTFIVVSCNNEGETILSDQGNEVALEENQDVIVTSAEELDQIILRSSTSAKMKSMTARDKIQFLSDYIAKQVSSTDQEQRAVAQIVCIAQVFDGRDYYTRLAFGVSTDTRIRAWINEDFRNEPLVAGSGNIYSNGVNIGGYARQRSDLGSCLYIEARSRATYPYDGKPDFTSSTYVSIGCDD